MASIKTNSNSESFGVGQKYASRSSRIINKDGSFNITRISKVWGIYHSMIEMSWRKFLLVVLLAYLIINSTFAGIYLMLGVEHISGVEEASIFENFLAAFYFSCQTMTTVGYGFFHPENIATNIVASLEALFGLLCFALATGLVYGKFSKPKSNLIFSRHALIAPYKGIKSFQFRIANQHNSILVEVQASVMMVWNEKENGQMRRRFAKLDLEMDQIDFLTMRLDHSPPYRGEQSPLQ